MCDACAALFDSVNVCVEPPAEPASTEPAPVPVAIDDITTEIENRPSAFAQAAVLLGLWAFLPFYFIGLVCAIPGLICGVIALQRINADPLRYGGRRYAHLGMGLSAVALLGWAICIPTVVMPTFTRAAVKAQERVYLDHLTTIRAAIDRFHADTSLYPARLEDMSLFGNATLAYVPNGTYHGPYLTDKNGIAGSGVPQNPYADGDTVDAQWSYDAKTGDVKSAVQLPEAVQEMVEKQVTSATTGQ